MVLLLIEIDALPERFDDVPEKFDALPEKFGDVPGKLGGVYLRTDAPPCQLGALPA